MFGWLKSKKRTPKVYTGRISDDNYSELTGNLDKNILTIKEIIGHSSDVVIRSFKMGHTQWKVAVVYVDGLVDKTTLQEQVIKPLMQDRTFLEQYPIVADQIKNTIMDTVISVGEIKEVYSLNDCV